MALDAALLSDLKHEQQPILHFYDWRADAATYGHFTQPEVFLNLEAAHAHGLDLAKRPTGGGIIFHNCDFAFSVLMPATHPAFSSNPLDNYAFVNNRVMEAIQPLVSDVAALLPDEPQPLDAHCKHFCMAKPTKYDVMIGGKKIGGAAQRKTRDGYLHQGSIALGLLPEDYLYKVLASETQVVEAMRANSFTLLGPGWTRNQLIDARLELRSSLQKVFNNESII
ncbi:MAG: Octanoyltransferase LipM [Chlamydiales bacterium]|nr:Octanoyltransferase LipM [Chlamydiales bacterium]